MSTPAVNPLVSILIPCFNAERWVKQCIQSALDQTYEHKEVIVVDDGSTDGSADVISQFGDAITFHRVAHAGGNSARNRLTEWANGEWLQYLDADDYLLPDKITSQLTAEVQTSNDIDVVYSPIHVHDSQRPGIDQVLDIADNDASLTFIRWAPLNTGGLLMRRSAVLKVGAWKEDQSCCQEHELLLRMIMAGCRFALQNRAEVVYRRHSRETVSRRDPLRVIQIRMQLTDRIADFLESRGKLTPEHKKAVYVARLESARSVYSQDSALAEQLGAKAAALGNWWVSSSPALPLRYQLVFRLAGFRHAERLAAWVRHRKGSAGQKGSEQLL